MFLSFTWLFGGLKTFFFYVLNYRIFMLQVVNAFDYFSFCMKALYHSPHPLPTFKNLTNLHLEFKEYSCHIYWWKVLPRLLESTPSLEVLVLDKVSCDEPLYGSTHLVRFSGLNFFLNKIHRCFGTTWN